MLTRGTRSGLWVWAVLVVAFLWLPLLVMAVYAFNSSNVQSWPIPGFTTKWFVDAWRDEEVRDALWLSVRAGLMATGIALVLGSMAAFALARFRFFGQGAISFIFVLPIALPGIITGMALNSFFTFWKVNFSLWTIIAGHATFCVVIVFNNMLARLRRTSGSYFEASSDLGATGWQTFRFVTFPAVRTALVAGALLAFALSWDEIVVTYFTAGAQNTLPLLIFGKIRQGQELPVVNVIALVVMVVTVFPVFLAQRLTTGHDVERARRARRRVADGPRAAPCTWHEGRRREREAGQRVVARVGQATPVPPSPQ
jgi:putative spermidine/putrescine transport system permease protein